MKTLYLLRHGQTFANVHKVYNPDTDSLTPHGQEQARAAAAYIQQLPVDGVFCSPLPRAVETARMLGVKATPVEALGDHKFGVFAGKPWGSLRQEATSLGISREEFVPEGGESLVDARHRVVEFVNSLPDGSYLIIAHAGTVIDLVHALTGRAWQPLHVDNVAIWQITDGHLVHENYTPWISAEK